MTLAFHISSNIRHSAVAKGKSWTRLLIEGMRPYWIDHVLILILCRYPVRDPFFRMLPRSMQNFMNAFTSLDHTSYLFSTTNPQDFRNLMSVYLDATLNPLLERNDFYQEGWRIGPADPTQSPAVGQDPGNDLIFKGVVYNEMKGSLSDAGSLYYRKFLDHILPDLNNSAGDPEKITDLTHEQLKKFHADHYHPSNAKILTYGNIPLQENLEHVSARLSDFGSIKVDHDIKLPISLKDGPKTLFVTGPADPLVPREMQYKTSITWVTCDTADVVETFGLSVLSSLLLDGYGSPFSKSLIDTGLGPEFAPNTGFDAHTARGLFSVGMSGVTEENLPKVHQAIFATLKEAKDKGFSASKVDGILHQLELALKHKTAQFGLGLIERVQSGWFNGIDPFNALAWNEVISAFKTKYAKGHYLEGLLERYLLNDNILTFTMEPHDTYEKDAVDRESKRLKSKIDEVAQQFGSEESAREQLQNREMELLRAQETSRDQDLSCLPTLKTTDISRNKDREPVREATVNDVKVQWRESHTNGLTYFRAINTFKDLPDELREMVPLFCASVMKLGTKDKTVEELEDLMKLKTGGVNVGYHSSTSPMGTHHFEEGLMFSGYALDNNMPAMLDLIRTLIYDTDFSSSDSGLKIKQLLQASASSATNDIAESGHAYAGRFAEAGLTPEGRLIEQVSGIAQIRLTTNLAARMAEEPLGDVIDKLKILQSIALTNTSSMRVALTCGSQSAAQNEATFQRFLEALPRQHPTLQGQSISASSRNLKTFFPLPYQVYYTGLAVPTVPYVDAAAAPLQILSRLLSNGHLHHEIREKGGAYGGGAYSKSLRGVFGLYSYRDPNPQNTLKIFKEAGAWAVNRAWSKRELDEAKLSVFQNLDAPRSVSQEGMTQFLSGIDGQMEQTQRERLLDVTVEDVKTVAQKYLVDRLGDAGRVAIFGKPTDWANESSGWAVEELGAGLSAKESSEASATA